MVQATKRLNPFPGLRPFEFGEEYLFFGREGQADELVRRLQQHRFVAVVGPSGSGKSSLVRAGLLPAIHSGFLQAEGSYWLKAVVRPGGAPIRNLALGLNQPDVLGDGEDDAELQGLLVESTLRQGRLGLVEAVRLARMEPHHSLLVVVDQFEELFRFQKGGERRGDSGREDIDRGEADEAAAFVKLLLEAVQQQEQPIYVVLTMRSDFLGDCARFVGLPEVINDSQYLIPRMTRDQRRLAIEGPIGVVGGTISPRLVQRLLNDVGDDLDQLPILQHALMRTWDFWQNNHESREPLDVRHYETVGSMAAALSNHADDIFGQLTGQQKEITKRLFQRLTERGQDGREIRRPTSLSEIAQVADVSEEDVIGVVEWFRRGNNSFLMPPPPEGLSSATVLDISHESLMRIWGRLKDWVVEEAESSQEMLRLVDRASRYPSRAGLLREPELSFSLNWRRDERPTLAWAKRYAEGFEDAIAFLETSVEARDREIAEQERLATEKERVSRRRFRQVVGVAIGMALLASGAIGAAVWAVRKTEEANREKRRAERRELNAELLAESLKTDNLLANHLQLEALMTAIRMGQRIERLETDIDRDIRWRSEASFREVVYTSRERHRLESHGESVWSVSFSPNGETLASASDDGTVKLWTLEGEELQTLEGHRGRVWSVSFSPNGETLASASEDGT
ncbi:MAG: AAA family ATPase, partial [Cyanobacteria bacterium P01_E01_bin.34]